MTFAVSRRSLPPADPPLPSYPPPPPFPLLLRTCLTAADLCASLCKESAEWPAVVMGTTNLSAPLPTCKLYRWTEGSINCGVSGYKTVSRAGQGWA